MELEPYQQDWLVMVDRYSGYPFAQRLKSLSSESIFNICLNWFHDWGFPRIIRSDNGPQFRQKFGELCAEHFIAHETSSPYNPASNGLAEAAVKNVKFLLKKCLSAKENFSHALLHWRNVPRSDGISPSQAFLGRRQRTSLPDFCSHFSDYKPAFSPDFRAVDRHEMKEKFDRKSKDLSVLTPGDRVLCQDPLTKLWSQEGTILEVDSHKRSYLVRINDKNFRRNRILLKPHPAPLQLSHNLPAPELDPADSSFPPLPRISARLAAPNSAKSVKFMQPL